MIPFYVLILSFLIFRVLGLCGIQLWNDWQVSLQYAVGAMFLLTASAHWGKKRADLTAMVPRVIPHSGLVVTITGILEIVGAISLTVPALSFIAAMGLAALLLMMFPANIRAARRKLSIGGRPVPPLLQRTLLQIVFLAAVLLTIKL